MDRILEISSPAPNPAYFLRQKGKEEKENSTY